MTTIKEARKNNQRIEIYADEYGFSSRQDIYETIGKLAIPSSSSSSHLNETGGKLKVKECKAFVDKVKKDGGIVLPLYRLSHTSVAYSTTPFNDSWDSGQIGFVYVEKEQLEKEDISKEQAISILKSEIKTFSAWANGEVYGVATYNWDSKTCEWILSENIGVVCEEYSDAITSLRSHLVDVGISEELLNLYDKEIA